MSVSAIFLFGLFHAVPCVGDGAGCSVDVRVGSASMRMVVDTGADLTILSRKAARRAGIRLDRESPLIFIRGVNGMSVAALASVKIRVGTFEEQDVLVAVVPELGMDGLLGMTFLERFKFGFGGRSLELEPPDKDEEKRGGHGPSWWSLRFKENRERLARYEQMLPAAKDVDESIAGEIGTSPDEITLTEITNRLRNFTQEETDRLSTEAARASVPNEWRR